MKYNEYMRYMIWCIYGRYDALRVRDATRIHIGNTGKVLPPRERDFVPQRLEGMGCTAGNTQRSKAEALSPRRQSDGLLCPPSSAVGGDRGLGRWGALTTPRRPLPLRGEQPHCQGHCRGVWSRPPAPPCFRTPSRSPVPPPRAGTAGRGP